MKAQNCIYHGHKKNSNLQNFLNQMRTRVSLFSSPNHEIKQTKRRTRQTRTIFFKDFITKKK